MAERKGYENLIKGKDTQFTSGEKAVENGRKGGIASGKAKKERKTIEETIKKMMGEEAPEKIRRAFQKNGYDPATHIEAITAAILMGAMKGDPRMIDKAMELIGEDYKRKMREAEVKMQRERLAMEKEKAEIEKRKAEAWMEAVKNQQEAEMEDDGFMDALKGTAKEDWSDEDI